MAEQAELAFVKNFLNTLSSVPVTYGDDYQQPPQNYLKKVPILQIDLPAPPERKPEAISSTAAINVTFKSLKPSKSYTLSVHPTDTVSDIKSQLASSQPGAPPADVQRLLLKGKALADGKLLKEYSVKDGDTINLMTKPGYDWDPSKAASNTNTMSPPHITVPGETKKGSSHRRVPSLILSPSPSSSSPGPEDKPVDILLSLDTSSIPNPNLAPDGSSTNYHNTVVQPAFWQGLLSFLNAQFVNPADARQAWEDFFCASKGTLSASEIARIRDHVGIHGMAGT